MNDSGPQVENGYTRYANELLEALCKLKCRNEERRLIDAVARLTYGMYGKKSARIENQALMDITGLPYWQLWRARDTLQKRNIIICSTDANHKTIRYRINKYYRTWKNIAPELKSGTGAIKDSTDATKHSTGANGTLYKENNNKPKRKDGADAPADPPADPPRKPKKPPPPYQKIVEYLNALTGSNFNHKNEATRGQIRARFRTGYTEQDFYDVIDVKTDQWLGNPKMTSYLRPDTLFRPTKFDAYLQEAKRSKILAKSERQKVKERRYKIAAGILRESGQEACLRYCQDNNIDAEDFKLWISKLTTN